jgi:hypothetical protein
MLGRIKRFTKTCAAGGGRLPSGVAFGFALICRAPLRAEPAEPRLGATVRRGLPTEPIIFRNATPGE